MIGEDEQHPVIINYADGSYGEGVGIGNNASFNCSCSYNLIASLYLARKWNNEIICDICEAVFSITKWNNKDNITEITEV
jgi:hypothetical protein